MEMFFQWQIHLNFDQTKWLMESVVEIQNSTQKEKN